jgi:hypothetical protein
VRKLLLRLILLHFPMISGAINYYRQKAAQAHRLLRSCHDSAGSNQIFPVQRDAGFDRRGEFARG